MDEDRLWHNLQLIQKLNDRMFLSYHCHDIHKIGTRQTYLNQNEIIGTTWFNQDLDLEYFLQFNTYHY